MAKLTNCKQCGALFIQKGINTGDLCAKCLARQNELIDNIQQYVENAADLVSEEDILKEFDITLKEFETFYIKGKFIKIANKLMIQCKACHKITPALGNSNMICPECAKKIRNDFDSNDFI